MKTSNYEMVIKPLSNVIRYYRYQIVSIILNFIYFFYLGFLSRKFTIHRTAGEGGEYLFSPSLPLPPASQTLRHQPDNYCGELTSAHNQQPNSNCGPLVSERKSLTTNLERELYLTRKNPKNSNDSTISLLELQHVSS